MAALEGDAELHFDDQNNVEIQFIDEEDLPLANFIEPLMRNFTLVHRNQALTILAKSWKRKITLTTKWNWMKKIGLEKLDAE